MKKFLLILLVALMAISLFATDGGQTPVNSGSNKSVNLKASVAGNTGVNDPTAGGGESIYTPIGGTTDTDGDGKPDVDADGNVITSNLLYISYVNFQGEKAAITDSEIAVNLTNTRTQYALDEVKFVVSYAGNIAAKKDFKVYLTSEGFKNSDNVTKADITCGNFSRATTTLPSGFTVESNTFSCAPGLVESVLPFGESTCTWVKDDTLPAGIYKAEIKIHVESL